MQCLILPCRFSAAVLAAILLAGQPGEAQDDPAKTAKADAIRKEIADLNAKVEAKQAELRKLVPSRGVNGLNPRFLEVGTHGRFTDNAGIPSPIKVFSVLGPDKMLISVGVDGGSPYVMLKGYKTAGLADGSLIMNPGTFRVIGTERFAGTTHFVAEPH